MIDTLQQALDTPGCERLRDFAAVGPAQRAALELFVDLIRAAEGEPVAWRVRRNDGKYELHFVRASAERASECYIKRPQVKPLYTAPPKAAQMTEEEILVRFDEIVNARAPDSKIIAFARLIEARKARPMTDEEMILRGWRRCAVGQRTTQYCGQVQKAVAAEREACAQVLDDWKKHNWTFEDCAVAVRARGEK